MNAKSEVRRDQNDEGDGERQTSTGILHKIAADTEDEYRNCDQWESEHSLCEMEKRREGELSKEGGTEEVGEEILTTQRVRPRIVERLLENEEGREGEKVGQRRLQ